jgi:hypothetical protein
LKSISAHSGRETGLLAVEHEVAPVLAVHLLDRARISASSRSKRARIC